MSGWDGALLGFGFGYIPGVLLYGLILLVWYAATGQAIHFEPLMFVRFALGSFMLFGILCTYLGCKGYL